MMANGYTSILDVDNIGKTTVKITSIAPSVEIFRLAFYMHNVYHPTDWWLIFRINYRLFPNYV